MATPLTPYSINKIFQTMTISALQLPDNSFDLVRVGWQQQGQPGWLIDEDRCIITTVEQDDPYNRARDVEYLVNDDESVLEVTSYVRVWRVNWTFYGPNSSDRARLIKSMLFQTASHDTLSSYQLYLVTDVAAPNRVPEIYISQWWERVDFSAEFNEEVTETALMGTVKSTEILVQDAGGELADITISTV